MPRTASFDLSEVKTTTSKVPQPKYRSNLNSHDISNNAPRESKPEDEKCCHCSCGWTVGLLISACSLTFIVMFSLFPERFISQIIIVEREHRLLIQKGFLRVYPNLPKRNVEENDRVPGVYVIDPSSEYIKAEIVPSIEEVLKNYKDVGNNTYPPNPYILCWLENPLEADKPCYFDKNWILKECTKENDYGYKSKQGLYSPCILLRLEQTDDWEPQIFKRRDVNEAWLNDYDASHFAVGCYPSVKQPGNHKNLKVKIHPKKGFPIHFFPQRFFHENFYLSPMVMVQFMDLEVGKNFSVDCWIQARNSWFLKDNGVVQIHFRFERTSTEMLYFKEDTDNITDIQSVLKNGSSF